MLDDVFDRIRNLVFKTVQITGRTARFRASRNRQFREGIRPQAKSAQTPRSLPLPGSAR